MTADGLAHTDRERAESFGASAIDYDRHRPSYPDELIDDLVELVEQRPAAVLDIGCGTGKAARLLAARGLDVLGVEVDARMAEVARTHGIRVEVGGFETWDERGRQFDLLVSGQAWHWLDPQRAVPKAARLLRPGGTLALFWNYGEFDRSVQDEFDEVYRRHAPDLLHSVAVRARPAARLEAAQLEGSRLFADMTERHYPWQCSYSAAQWTGLMRTHSDHLLLDPRRLTALSEAVAAAIERLGGAITVRYRTYTLLARRPA